VLFWTSTAAVLGTIASRDWLVPPGYGLWIPGGVEHGGTVLQEGEMSIIHFAADRCPITWTEPTGIAVGPLLRELIRHLRQIGPKDPSRAPRRGTLARAAHPAGHP
jgi:hypothetical protein